jgi:hypothetical protein
MVMALSPELLAKLKQDELVRVASSAAGSPVSYDVFTPEVGRQVKTGWLDQVPVPVAGDGEDD